jgi:hypothetical protein
MLGYLIKQVKGQWEWLYFKNNQMKVQSQSNKFDIQLICMSNLNRNSIKTKLK